MSRRLLLTGASGQVGSALRSSLPADTELVAPDSRAFDLSDPEVVRATIRELEPEVVINAAAYTAVDRAEDDPARAYAVNEDGPRSLAAGCAEVGAALIHLSTDYVFDGLKDGPYTEADRPNPVGVYGASKLAGEKAVAEQLPRHVILRVSWVFSATGGNFVKTMLKLADREELGVVDDQRGTPCSATHIAHRIWQIVERMDELALTGTYHFRSTPVVSWCQFATQVFSEYQSAHQDAQVPTVIPISTAEYPTRAARPANSVLDGARLEQMLGVSAPDWRVALKEVVRQLAGDGGGR